MPQRTCSIEGCIGLHEAHGWCYKHYARWRRHGDPLGVPPEVVLFEQLASIETDDHVLWPRRLVHGYGIVHFQGRQRGTHRVALRLRVDMLADQTLACHKAGLGCPKHCMNYRHLYWGTSRDNGSDMVIDGHSTRGERQPNHVLTEDDVREIRRLKETTSLTWAQIADRIGANWLTVRSAAQGQSWAWLDRAG